MTAHGCTCSGSESAIAARLRGDEHAEWCPYARGAVSPRARTNFQQMQQASLAVRGELEYLDWSIDRRDVAATRNSVAQMRNLLQRITLACELVELDGEPEVEAK